MVYTIALSKVVWALNDPIKSITFCLGFSEGLVVGTVFEDRLALVYRGVMLPLTAASALLSTNSDRRDIPKPVGKLKGRPGSKSS